MNGDTQHRPSSPSKTTDQIRAAHAWESIRQATKLPDREKKEFGLNARKLPMRILTSGLGPALAFLEAKNYAPLLLDRLADWVLQQQPSANGGQGTKRLTVRIVEGDCEFLRFATTEALAYLQWLIRFAEAEKVIPKDEQE